MGGGVRSVKTVIYGRGFNETWGTREGKNTQGGLEPLGLNLSPLFQALQTQRGLLNKLPP